MIPKVAHTPEVVDYRTIASMPISKRIQYAQQNPNFISLLSPGQVASLFPKAYMDWAGSSNFTSGSSGETKVASLEEPGTTPSSPGTSTDPIIPKLPQTATPIDDHGKNEQPVTLSGSNANKGYQYFRSQGYTDIQAKAMVAGLVGESGPNLDKWTPKNGEDAFGAGQWHPYRRDLFQKQYGKSIYDSTLEEQFAFKVWELNHNEKASGDKLRSATTLEDAISADVGYERPKDTEGAYKTRLEIAQGLQFEEAKPDDKQTAELLPTKHFDPTSDKHDPNNPQSDSSATTATNSTPASSLEYQKLLQDQVANSSQFGVSGTAQQQGLSQSLARMHPEYLRRAEAVQKQLKDAGLPAYLYSNYRPKEYGVNNHAGWSSDKSMHGFGLASDWGGLTGKDGRLLVTPEQYQKFSTIMESNGFSRPWKSDVERNHWQIVPNKTVDDPEIIKIRDQWAKGGYSDDTLKHKLDVAINNYYKFGPEADSLVNPKPTSMDAKDLIQQAKGELNEVDKQAFETRPEMKDKILQKYAENKGLTYDPKTQTFTQPNAPKQTTGQAVAVNNKQNVQKDTATVEPTKATTTAQQVASLDTSPIATPSAEKVGPLPIKAISVNTDGTASNPSDEQYNIPKKSVPVSQEKTQTDSFRPEPSSKMTTSSVQPNPVPIVSPQSSTPSSLSKAYERSDFGGTRGLGDSRGV